MRASSLRAFIYARGRERYSSMTLYTHAQVTSRGTGDAADLRLSIAYILTYRLRDFDFGKIKKKKALYRCLLLPLPLVLASAHPAVW